MKICTQVKFGWLCITLLTGPSLTAMGASSSTPGVVGDEREAGIDPSTIIRPSAPPPHITTAPTRPTHLLAANLKAKDVANAQLEHALSALNLDALAISLLQNPRPPRAQPPVGILKPKAMRPTDKTLPVETFGNEAPLPYREKIYDELHGCIITARFDCLDNGESLCTGTVFVAAAGQEAYTFEFSPSSYEPDEDEFAALINTIGTFNPIEGFRMPGAAYKTLRTPPAFDIEYRLGASTFILSVSGTTERYSAEMPHIETAPPLAAFLQLMPELHNDLLLTAPRPARRGQALVEGDADGIHFGEDGRLYDADGDSIATS